MLSYLSEYFMPYTTLILEFMGILLAISIKDNPIDT